MAALIELKTAGLERALYRLKELNRGVRNKILRPALRAAGKPIIAAVRDRLPERSGWLKKAQAAKVKTYGRSGAAVLLVGPRTKYKSPAGEVPTNVMHLVEGGRKGVRPLKSRGMPLAAGVLRGSAREVRGRPAIGPAVAATQQAVEAILAAEFTAGLAKL